MTIKAWAELGFETKKAFQTPGSFYVTPKAPHLLRTRIFKHQTHHLGRVTNHPALSKTQGVPRCQLGQKSSESAGSPYILVLWTLGPSATDLPCLPSSVSASCPVFRPSFFCAVLCVGTASNGHLCESPSLFQSEPL